MKKKLLIYILITSCFCLYVQGQNEALMFSSDRKAENGNANIASKSSVFASYSGDSAVKNTAKLFIHNGYTFAHVNMHEEKANYYFLIDLGTDRLVITQEIVDDLNYKDSFQLELDNIKIPVNSKDSMMRIVDATKYEYFQTILDSFHQNARFAGILGNVVFSHGYFVMDFPHNKIKQIRHKEFDDKSIHWIPFIYVSNQIFIKANLNGLKEGYFHIDNGIPNYSLLTYSHAQDVGLKNLKNKPNQTGKTVYEMIYDSTGTPIQRIEQVVSFTNHYLPCKADSFIIGGKNIGSVSFFTMNTDLNQEVFTEVSLNPIIGSLAYKVLRKFEIHIDIKNRRLAFAIP